MKNNKILFSQFCFSSFLCTLSALLFIDYNPSVLYFIILACVLLIDTLVIFVYKGNNIFLKAISAIYCTVFCVIICEQFCKYMYYDLGYGPFWILALLILGFAFFCTVKGFEPISRASVIITVFIVFSLIFIAVSSFNNIDFTIHLYMMKSPIIPLLLLFPSAMYILNKENIIEDKKYTFNIYTASTFAVLIYFYLLPKNKVALGIFKGADGLLLAVLTVSVIFFISNTTLAVFKNAKHKYLTNSLYLFVLGLITVSLLYLNV
ncbi:MAG: hypothetical protein IJT79_02610 [Ruminococcus sp.]|nr:hypothetical protein [Ruminococcus sp.]